MSLVLGVDGGNSKTVALVGDASGSILGSGRSGCSDIYAAGSAQAAFAEVDAAVVTALNSAGVTRRDLAAGAFSMAGADWPEDFGVIRSAMKSRGYGAGVTVVNDALGALRAGSVDGIGVAVVCGTGAATGARDADGNTWHSSWWQQTQGAVDLAGKALAAVYRSELGIGPPTRLTRRVLDIFGAEGREPAPLMAVRTVEDVLHLFTRRGRHRPKDLGRVTKALLEEAEHGDQVSVKIVLDHGSSLGDYAVVAAKRVGLASSSFNLVLSGAVLRGGPGPLGDAIISRVLLDCPLAVPRVSSFEPAVGAFLLALDMKGIQVDEVVFEHLAATSPPLDLYAT